MRRERYSLVGVFCVLEGVQTPRLEIYAEMRVLTKIQVNLVIPKGIFMVMFQPEGGDIYIGELLP